MADVARLRRLRRRAAATALARGRRPPWSSSSHGGDEAGEVRAALEGGVGFVGVVCSRTRGDALLAELDLTPAEAARVHMHVGLDIGARTAPEVGLSIVAAIVRSIRVEGLMAAPPAPGGAVARARPSTRSAG